MLQVIMEEISLPALLILILVGFIFGLVIDQISGILTRVFWKSHSRPNYSSDLKITNSQKLALVREKSPSNYKIIENSNAFKGMCDNLAFVFFVLFLIASVRFFSSGNKYFWVFIILVSIISFLSLCLKARKYSRWAKQDVDSVIDMINDKSL